jgi:hypothetical protein
MTTEISKCDPKIYILKIMFRDVKGKKIKFSWNHLLTVFKIHIFQYYLVVANDCLHSKKNYQIIHTRS